MILEGELKRLRKLSKSHVAPPRMKYSKGQTVIVQKVAEIRGRKAKIIDIIKAKNKPTIYRLDVEGFAYPYHCTSAYIKLAEVRDDK